MSVLIPVILTIHVIVVIALIAVVLLQRSDGGALGLGGGVGGGFMTGRGAANALTRTTSILTALFFTTSISLAILAGRGETEETVIEQLTGEQAQKTPPAIPGQASTDDLLRTLGADSESDAAKPNPDAAAAPDASADGPQAGEEKPAADAAPDTAADQPPAEDAPSGDEGSSDEKPNP